MMSFHLKSEGLYSTFHLTHLECVNPLCLFNLLLLRESEPLFAIAYADIPL